MNYNTPAFTGCLTPGITPNLDRLASEGMRFVTRTSRWRCANPAANA